MKHKSLTQLQTWKLCSGHVVTIWGQPFHSWERNIKDVESIFLLSQHKVCTDIDNGIFIECNDVGNCWRHAFRHVPYVTGIQSHHSFNAQESWWESRACPSPSLYLPTSHYPFPAPQLQWTLLGPNKEKAEKSSQCVCTHPCGYRWMLAHLLVPLEPAICWL